MLSAVERPARIRIPTKEEFEEQEGFIDAPELAVIGRSLVDEPKNEIEFVANLDVRYCWAEKASKVAGVPMYGDIKRPGKLWRHISDGVDYVVLLGADALLEVQASTELITKVIFRQLLHIGHDQETGKLSLRGPDVSFFHKEIERSGLWTPALQEARVTLDQMPLPFERTLRAS